MRKNLKKHTGEPDGKKQIDSSKGYLFVCVFLLRGWKHGHGEDGGHCVQGGDEDSNLADGRRQQQSPGGLTVGLAMSKDLKPRTAP